MAEEIRLNSRSRLRGDGIAADPGQQPPPAGRTTPAGTLIKLLLLGVGSLAVALGFAGIFLPLLPTTPFLLLAAACYARSSERFLHWLLTNRWCGDYIRNYREGRGITRRHKILAIALLWATIGSSAVFAVSSPWVRGMLAAIATAVTIHLLRIRTFRHKPKQPAARHGRKKTSW